MKKWQRFFRSYKGKTILVFFLFLFLFLSLHSTVSNLVGNDGPYHIRLAQIMSEKGVIYEFPWTQIGLWSHHFADKEFLFHIYLIPFAKLRGISLPSLDPSGGWQWFQLTYFHCAKLALSLLAALIFSLFYYILKTNRVPYGFFWTFLLFSSSLLWSYRLVLLRPHVMSIFLFLLSLHFALQKRWLALLITSFVYPLAYHAAFVLLGACLIQNFVYYWRREPLALKSLGACILGLALGYMVHPHFPKNIKLFYLQNAEVISHSVSNAPGISQELGSELQSMTTKGFSTVNWCLLTLWAALLFWAVGQKRKISSLTQVLMGLALSFFGLTLILGRFTEYWVPLSLLFFAHLSRDLLAPRRLRISWPSVQSRGRVLSLLATTAGFLLYFFVLSLYLPLERENIFPYLIFLCASFLFVFFEIRHQLVYEKISKIPLRKWLATSALLLFLLFSSSWTYFLLWKKVELSERKRHHSYQRVGEYLEKKTPAKSTVYHCCWDMFPLLFYHSPQQRYMLAMDPTFLFGDSLHRIRKVKDKKYDLWDHYLQLKKGEEKDPHFILQEVFRADYIVVHPRHKKLITQLTEDSQFRLLYSDRGILLFEIR